MGKIAPRDVVRNKHYPNLIYRNLPINSDCYGSLDPSGYLGRGGVDNPVHWERVPLLDWWKIALRWYLRNILWYLNFIINNGLGLIGREIPVPHAHLHYRNPNYFIRRAVLMTGNIPQGW